MSSTRTLTGTVLVVGLLALGLGIYQRQKSERLRAANADVTRRQEATLREWQDLRSRATAADQVLANLEKQIASQDAAPGSPPVATPAQTPPVPAMPKRDIAKEKADWQRFVAAHPEAHAIMVEKYKDQLHIANRPIFLLAELSPAQGDALLTRMAENAAQNVALSPTIDLPIEGGTDLGLITQRPELLREIVGEDMVSRLPELNRLLPAARAAANVRNAAVQGVPPLSPDQERQLTRLIAQSSPDYRNGQAVNLTTVDWASVQAQAQSFLSPEQLRAATPVMGPSEFNQARTQILRGAAKKKG